MHYYCLKFWDSELQQPNAVEFLHFLGLREKLSPSKVSRKVDFEITAPDAPSFPLTNSTLPVLYGGSGWFFTRISHSPGQHSSEPLLLSTALQVMSISTSVLASSSHIWHKPSFILYLNFYVTFWATWLTCAWALKSA